MIATILVIGLMGSVYMYWFLSMLETDRKNAEWLRDEMKKTCYDEGKGDEK
jgi:hypothetical protein